MLRQRVVTAVLLAPAAVWATLALPGHGFALLIAVVLCLGAWEWTTFAGLEQRIARYVYVLMLAGLIFMFLDQQLLLQLLLPMTVLALVWWLPALLFVIAYPAGSAFWSSLPGAVSLAGVLSLLPAWFAISGLHILFGPGHVLLLFCLVWGADIGAFFVGRIFGRRKLAPQVSPGKTWAGVGGALLASIPIALAGGWLLKLPATGFAMVLLCLLTVAFSIIGDLAESMFKRRINLKDSGHLLPGHGGVLDRIDSLLAAAPIFTLGLLLIRGPA